VGWSVQLVECILALKTYHENKEGGREDVRKFERSLKTPSCRKQLLTKQKVGFPLVGAGRASKNIAEDLETSWVSSGGR
jgi:FixJ family two-component response regulator